MTDLSTCSRVRALSFGAAVLIGSFGIGATTLTESVSLDFPVPQSVDSKIGTQIVLFQDEAIEVRRSFPHGYIDVYSRDAKGEIRWPLPLQVRKGSYPLSILADRTNLYLVVYDVIKNVPSGRTTVQVKSGIDVLRLSKADKKVHVLAEGLQLGGVDTLVHGAIDGEALSLCGANRCYSVTPQATKEWLTPALVNRDIIELKFRGGRAAALLRPTHDDRTGGALANAKLSYELALFDPKGASKVQALGADVVPWDLQWSSGKPTFSVARTAADFRRVFYFDFRRMPFRGGIDFGVSNLEGRVAWSQFYYLSALLSIAEGKLPEFAGMQSAKNRACAEAVLISQLGQTSEPGYAARRYAIDREALLSALHLGRIAELLKRAELIGCKISPRVLEQLAHQLSRFEGTLEQPATFDHGGRRWEYLRMRKGAPFWADGANVPYNYVSGFVRGYWALHQGQEATRWGEKFLAPLLINELQNLAVTSWRYWWGVADEGWTEDQGVSLNTPVYPGNKGAAAHISYRTMDAAAVLALHRRAPE